MNKKGVSAVIGVILMVAITVAIAATVYVYVSNMIGDDDHDECLDSYDNIKFNFGYEIYNHNCEVLSSYLSLYKIDFYIGQPNSTSNLWVKDFIYDYYNDVLYYSGNSAYISEIINEH